MIMHIDTTVLIDYLKQREEAEELLELKNVAYAISSIVFMEVIAGIDRKKDVTHFLNLMKSLSIRILYPTEIISENAFELFVSYYRKGIGIADSFIAASAIVESVPLITHNEKHFTHIKSLDIIVPY